MYLVVSKWEAVPGKESEFITRSMPVRETLRSQPGVLMVEAIFDGKTATSIHAYKDEATYKAVVQNESGPFARAMKEHRLEEVATWVSSVRGETV